MSLLLVIALALIFLFCWILILPSKLSFPPAYDEKENSNVLTRIFRQIRDFLWGDQVIYFIVPLLCYILYSRILMIGHSSIETGEQMCYFRDLAWSFLHGRLDIDSSDPYDLVNFEGKFYLYWPPVPALLYMPIVAIFGLHLPDALINSFYGAISVGLFMLVMNALGRKFSIPFGRKELIWLGIFWGLGTVHFYMSMPGTVWFISQIAAQMFLLASLLVFLKAKKPGNYILSGLWFALAVYTRNHMIFGLLFFAFLYLAKTEYKKLGNFFSTAIYFIIPLMIISILNLWYNYARFSDITENGLQYHEMSSYFNDNYNTWGYASLHYIPYNLYVEVVKLPQLMFKWPFIRYDAEGFGFIWASPLFLLLLPALIMYFWSLFNKKIFDLNDKLVMTGALLTTILVAVVIFIIMGTGWAQFGARYTLDFHLFLIIFLCFTYKKLSDKTYFRYLTAFMICLSVVINYLGVLVFFWDY